MSTVLKLILGRATPEIIEQIRQLVADFKVKTDETANPYDDMLADFMQAIVGKPKS